MAVTRFQRDFADPLPCHPNEMDTRRIERALKERKRYRYASPQVQPAQDGYRIRSACCSRKIEPDGGEIDIALLRWTMSPPGWALYRRDHHAEAWVLDSTFRRLAELLGRLNSDPDRIFWQ